MTFAAIIDTICLTSFVVLGLWIVAHFVQVARLLLMTHAYKHHNKRVFVISFFPLLTRLLHDMAVQQFLAAEALQRGELPPAPVERGAAGGAARAAPVPLEHVHPGIAPSLAMWASPPDSATSGTPLSSTVATSTSDTLKRKSPKKKSKTKRDDEDALRRAALNERTAGTEMQQRVVPTGAGAAFNSDDAVRVPIDGRAGEATCASAAAAVSWWTPQLDGQCLVIGLQLPLELLPTALSAPATSASGNTDARRSGATSPGLDAHHRGSSGGTSPPTLSSAGGATAGTRQPTVSLQLKQYQLTPASLTATTAVATAAAEAMASEYDGSTYGSAPHPVAASSQTQVVVAHQLAAVPVPVRTRAELRQPWPTTASPFTPPFTSAYREIAGLRRRHVAPPAPHLLRRQDQLDFDAVKYAYTLHYQRLLEAAVAEQTAIAHRTQGGRKSVKRAQRIAAMLAHYLEYVHEADDEDEDDGTGSPLVEGLLVDTAAGADELSGTLRPGEGAVASRGKRASVTRKGAAPGSSNSNTGLTSTAPAASRHNHTAAAAVGTSRRSDPKGGVGQATRAAMRTRVPWVPLLADSCPSLRLDDLYAAARRSAAQSSSARRHRQQQPIQLPTSKPLTDSMLLQQQRQGLLMSQSSTLLAPSSINAAVSAGGSLVLAPSTNAGRTASFSSAPRESHKSSRSKRQGWRSGAADNASSSISNSAVVALEALVEQVRLAQALRPGYRSLQCTVHFTAERHLVRRGDSEPPTWTALQAVTRPTTAAASPPSSQHRAAALKRDAATAVPSAHGAVRHRRASPSTERDGSGYGGVGHDVRGPLHASPLSSASTSSPPRSPRRSSHNSPRHPHGHPAAHRGSTNSSNGSTTTAAGVGGAGGGGGGSGSRGNLSAEASMSAFLSRGSSSMLVSVPHGVNEPSPPGRGLRGSRPHPAAPSRANREATLPVQTSNDFTDSAVPEDAQFASHVSPSGTSSTFHTPEGSHGDWGAKSSGDSPRALQLKLPPPLPVHDIYVTAPASPPAVEGNAAGGSSLPAGTTSSLLGATAGSGSSSANNAALEFLLASRLRENNKRATLTAGQTAPSACAGSNHVTHSAAPSTWDVGANASVVEEESYSSTISSQAATQTPRRDGLAALTGAAGQPPPSKAQPGTPHVAPDDVVLIAPLPVPDPAAVVGGEKRSGSAPQQLKSAPTLAPIRIPQDNTGDYSVPAADAAASEGGTAAAPIESAASAPSLRPRAHDLRLAYVIGADRSALLRALTLDATRSFGAGAQNYLCFFTARDERRARRRHMQRVDRQHQMERLWPQHIEAIQASAAAAEEETARAMAARRRADIGDDSAHDTSAGQGTRNTHDGDEGGGAALPAQSAGLGGGAPHGLAGPVLHARTVSWHDVNPPPGGTTPRASSPSADTDSAIDRRDGLYRAQGVVQTRHGTESSATSLFSFAAGGGGVSGVMRESASPLDNSADVDSPLGAHPMGWHRPTNSSFHSIPSLPAALMASPNPPSLEHSLRSAKGASFTAASGRHSAQDCEAAPAMVTHATLPTPTAKPAGPHDAGLLSLHPDGVTPPLLFTNSPVSSPCSPFAETSAQGVGLVTGVCSGQREGAARGVDGGDGAAAFDAGRDEEGALDEERRRLSLTAPHMTAEVLAQQPRSMLPADARERRPSQGSTSSLAATLHSMASLVFSDPEGTRVASPNAPFAPSLLAAPQGALDVAFEETTARVTVVPHGGPDALTEQYAPGADVLPSGTDSGNVLPLLSAPVPEVEAGAGTATAAAAVAAEVPGKATEKSATKKGGKAKSKKGAAALAAGAAAAETAAPAALAAPASLTRTQPAVPPLIDAVDAADVRTYLAAVGVTLPEQIYLIREAEAPTVLQLLLRALASSSHGSSTDVSGAAGSGGGGGASSRAAAVPPTVLLHAAYPSAAVLAAAAAAALTSGAVRVLEGQVEVAELSVDVLCRQIAPFVPREPPPMSSSDADEDEDSLDGGQGFHDAARHRRGSEDRRRHRGRSGGAHRRSSDASTTCTDASDEEEYDDVEDEVAFHEVVESRQADQRLRSASGTVPRHRGPHRSPNSNAADSKEQKKRTSRMHHAAVPPAAAASSEAASRQRGYSRHSSSHQHRRYRVSDERRRRRHERRLARHVARWQRRVRREQAAAAKANYVPIAVGALFFSVPPALPAELMRQQRRRWTEQRGSGELPRLLVPDWTLGLTTGVPAAEDRGRSASAEESAAVTALLPETWHQSPAAAASSCTVCVTLIYVTTAEHLAQTLGRAAQTAKTAAAVAAAAQRRRARAVAAVAPPSTTSFYSEASWGTIADTAAAQRRHGSGGSSSGLIDFSGAWSTNVDSGVYPPASPNSRPQRSFATQLGNSWRSHRRAAASTTAPPSCNGSLHCSFPSESSTPPPSPMRHSMRQLHSPLSGLSSPSPNRDFLAPRHGATELPPPHAGGAVSPPHSCTGTATFSEDEARDDSSNDEPAGARPVGRRAGDEALASSANDQPPSLLLLTDTADSVRELDEAEEAARDGAGLSRTATSVFADPYERFGGSAAGDRTLLDARDRHGDGGDANATRAVRFPAGAEEDKLGAADELMSVLRDTTCFPEGVPVGLTLAYVRIGNDLYAITEVVNRTFLQYREQRVLQTHGTRSARAGEGAAGDEGGAQRGNDNDNALVAAASSSSFSDSGEDDASSTSSVSNSSIASDTSVHTLDAALAAIQNQHKATAQQQRRCLHRRRAVSTSDFGGISYSLSGSAPVRPGMRRQEVNMCWRCLSAEATVIFVPCGHYAVCEDCAELLADCCVCRTPILSSVSLLDRGRAAPPRQQQQPAAPLSPLRPREQRRRSRDSSSAEPQRPAHRGKVPAASAC